MYKVITLKTDEGKDINVPFLANAATPFRFKSLFGKDLLLLFQKAVNNDGVYDIDFISELAFVMAMQAKARNEDVDLNTITRDNMIAWLEQFGGFEMLSRANEIMNVYLGNEKITSEEKKKVRKPRES
jgi:hypothetical protein